MYAGQAQSCARCRVPFVLGRYDVEAVRSVRQFKGHTDRITDLHMSADARWLLSASLDGTVRAWDVPSSMCLQASSTARLEQSLVAVTSLAVYF